MIVKDCSSLSPHLMNKHIIALSLLSKEADIFIYQQNVDEFD